MRNGTRGGWPSPALLTSLMLVLGLIERQFR